MPIELYDHHDLLEIRVRLDRFATDGERCVADFATTLQDEPLYHDTILGVAERKKRKDA